MIHSRFLLTFIIVAVAATMMSCDKNDTDVGAETLQKPPVTCPGGPLLTKAQQEMTVDVNDFGFELFRRLNEGKNLFVSPFSVSLALSMLTTGAAGNTEAELLKTLGFEGRTTEELDGYYSLLIDRFQSADSSVEAMTANSVWPDKDLKVNGKYISDCLKFFDSEVITVDYGDHSTLAKINDWCSRKTNGRIPEMLDRLPDGPMTLINAVYFKAKWAFTFFNVGKGKKRMQAKIRTAYFADESLSMVELPYGNGNFAMDVIVPGEKSSIEAIGKSLSAGGWNSILAGSEIADVMVSMPEFEFDWGRSIKNELKQMGIRDAFGNADFSPMSPIPLCVDDVHHKTYVKVDREGTEAAAVTVVEMKYTSAGPGPEIPEVSLTVGNKFIFLIRDRFTGAVIFIGQHV